MKTLLLLSAFSLPLVVLAQSRNTNPSVAQAANINYDQATNDDNDASQSNITDQQAAPQQGGSLSGGGNSGGTYCADCEKVKQAIKLSQDSSGGFQKKKSFGMKKWSGRVIGKMNMKMRKAFARKHKVRTTYAICFAWH